MPNEMKKESKELDMDKKKLIKPDGGYGWVILFVAFVKFFKIFLSHLHAILLQVHQLYFRWMHVFFRNSFG